MATSEQQEGKKTGGFFSSVGGAFNKMGKEIEKGVESASKKIDETRKSDLLSNFRTSMQLQLVSATSGNNLHNCGGMVSCRPAGGDDKKDNGGPLTRFFKSDDKKQTLWTVLDDGNNIVRLHNDNSYLAVVNGATVLVTYEDPSLTGEETQFRLQQSGTFVMFESVKEPKCHVGCSSEGSLRPAQGCGREEDAKFGVKVTYSPYPHTQK